MEDCLSTASVIARRAYQESEGWREGVRAGLGALLAYFEQEPEAGRALVVQAQCAGPEALARRRQALTALAAVLDRGRSAGRGRAAGAAEPAPSPLTGEGMVGAVLAVLHDRLATQASPRLSELVNPLMCMIVGPYIGAAAARRELARPIGAESSRRLPAAEPLEQLPMRITYRTMRVLLAVGGRPGSSNRQIACLAGIEDQGQASKMLVRLRRLGLIENAAGGASKGAANAWRLTSRGRAVERKIAVEARAHGA